ncbi:MAG: hypothetical protein R2856_06310 [Caldilineaceae bacterium]
MLAGLLPFVVNWIGATRMNAALPLAEAARAGIRMDASLPDFFVGAPGVNPSAIAELYATLAGLPQPLPGWLAGGLSSLGVWLSLPINWLGGWIVYGALVMAVNVALGATCTLQRFYAATGYAVVPLLLTAFAPVACLGPLASLIGVTLGDCCLRARQPGRYRIAAVAFGWRWRCPPSFYFLAYARGRPAAWLVCLAVI